MTRFASMTEVTAEKTRAEIEAFNAGVQSVLDIAQASAEALARTSKRRVHEDFAIAALAELAAAGRALRLSVAGLEQPSSERVPDR